MKNTFEQLYKKIINENYIDETTLEERKADHEIINESVNKKLKVKELINMLKQYNPDANVIFYTYQQDPDYLNYNLEPTPMDSIEQNYDGDVEIVISD